jgi:hypothetical protein
MCALSRSILALAMLLMAGQAFSFNVDGYSTGMTLKQFQRTVQSNGLSVIGGKDGFNYLIAEPGTTNFRGNVAFCKGALFFYNRPVDFDSDYAPLLSRLLKKYGQPKLIESKQSENGPGHHFIYNIVMKWLHGKDTIELSLTPQQLNSKGAYVAARSANITYISQSPCLH